MRVLSQSEANQLLRSSGFQIGNWNELKSLNQDISSYKEHRPSQKTQELYVFAWNLYEWLSPAGWILFQIDNSTAPNEDEVKIFQRLVLKDCEWDIANQKSFLFDNEQSRRDEATIVLLIYFSLVFEWHVHLVAENFKTGRRLALQDGIAYFMGRADALRQADVLLQFVEESPLRFVDRDG